jgi:eukaryotic-like serine/threonine-protein kinase
VEQTVLFGRYRLLERAGAGGSAQVWRAVDEKTGDEVAVKRLHPVVFADPTARRRLERESRALETLQSPNIVRIRDSHLTDDEAALVLDYVPGTSLADHLAQHGKLPVGEAVAIVRDIAAALTTAHSAGVVHRDVKPANIILAPDRHALLTDFGVARQGAEETIHGSVTEVTGHGLVVGSLRYMAPEQLRGEPATPASDQYGLAAVVCHMLIGSPPFNGATPVAIAEAHTAGPPSLPEVDAPLADAVRRGLAVDPSDRFPDVAAFAAAVGAAVRPAAASDATRVVPAVVPAADAVDAVDDPQPRAGSARPPAVAVGALVVALGLAALVALASIVQPRSPGGNAVAPPSQVATAAPSGPPTAEPAVDAVGEEDGGGGGKNGGGKAKGRDNDKSNGKDKKN